MGEAKREEPPSRWKMKVLFLIPPLIPVLSLYLTPSKLDRNLGLIIHHPSQSMSQHSQDYLII
jgi:hypothetical protein